MSAQVETKIEEMVEEFQRLAPEAQSQFLERAQHILRRDEEETARARAFLESRGLPVPQHPIPIRRKASLMKFLEELEGLPITPIDQSKWPEHDRVLYGGTFGDDE